MAAVPSQLTEETSLIFMGTGSSGGTPKLTCLTKKDGEPCETCFAAQRPGDPNNRRNTSVIIHTKWFQVRERAQIKPAGGCNVPCS